MALHHLLCQKLALLTAINYSTQLRYCQVLLVTRTGFEPMLTA